MHRCMTPALRCYIAEPFALKPSCNVRQAPDPSGEVRRGKDSFIISDKLQAMSMLAATEARFSWDDVMA